MNKLHEPFTTFFENPTRSKLREILQFNTGEYNNLDFKKMWPESSKIAKHILAMANSGGGALIVGVEENIDNGLVACGIETLIDKATLSEQLAVFIPTKIEYIVMDFHYKDSDYGELVGNKFQVLIVEYDPKILPVVSQREGKGLIANAIYVREGTSSKVANNEHLQKVFNIRISTNYDSTSEIELEEHLSQLKFLYNKIDKYYYIYEKNNASSSKGVFAKVGEVAMGISKSLYGEKVRKTHDYYPEENYEYFISRMIEKKKKKIEKVLDV